MQIMRLNESKKQTVYVHLRLSVLASETCLVDRGGLVDEWRWSVPKPSTSPPYVEEKLTFMKWLWNIMLWLMNDQVKKGLITEYKLHRHTNLFFARNTRTLRDFTVLGFTTKATNKFLVSLTIYKDLWYFMLTRNNFRTYASSC